MSRTTGRSNSLFLLLGAAGVAIVLALLSMLDWGGPRAPAKAGDIVLPAFEADVTRANRIQVTLAHDAYDMVRDSSDNIWRMPQRGDFPVRVDMLADLSEALASMTYSREMTQDPAKFDQLGLGDPREGGAGALLNVTDAKGDELVDLIVGFKNGASYVRAPGENQAWAVDAAPVPPLQRAARWLALDVIGVTPPDIASVEVIPYADEPFTLITVEDRAGQFGLAPPHDDRRLKSSYAANPPALALASLKPVDALPRDEVEAEPVSVHRTYLHSGLMIEAEVHTSEDGRHWVTFSEGLEAESPQLQAQLDDIEARVAGWAFEISAADHALFSTRLGDLVRP